MELSEYLRMIRESRDDWNDEIPSQIQHSTMIIDGNSYSKT